MKFVLTYKVRDGGSVEDRVRGAEAAQKLLANWTPSPSVTIHQWVQRCDGNGGFAVVENDNASDLFRDLNVWSAWLEFDAVPVIDVGDATVLQEESIQKAKGVL